MSQVTQFISEVDVLFKRCRNGRAALFVIVLFCAPHISSGQAAATAQAQETPALTGPLERADAGTQLHILYVHGMGIDTPKHKDGTQDFEVSQEFRTYCEAPLSSRGDAPLDEEEKYWDVVEHFEFGYSHFGSRVQSPCPADPKFPRFEDYALRFSELKTDPFWKWSCVAFAKTQMATLLSLVHGLGQTQEDAAAQVRESYDRYARRGY